MRIGLVVYGPLDTISGGFLYDRKLVEHIREQGDHVEIISLPWRSYARSLADNWTNTVASRLSQDRPDLMLQDELCHPSLFRINRRLRGYPIVSIVHHLRSSEQRAAWQNRLYGRVERAYLRSAAGFVFNSRTTQAAVEALTGAGRPSVVAHPAGDRLGLTISPKEVEERAGESGPLRVLFVGNVIPRKGLHTLIAALAGLPEGTAELEVAGSLSFDTGYVNAIRRQISAACLDSSISLPGSLGDRPLAERLRRSHVVAVPSSYEGYGIAYLEGMGAGLPAIGSTGGAAHEIIEHAKNGFLVPPGDTDAVAGHLLELNRDRDKLAAMGRNALSTFAAHPTWSESASRIREFLHTLAGQPSGPTSLK